MSKSNMVLMMVIYLILLACLIAIHVRVEMIEDWIAKVEKVENSVTINLPYKAMIKENEDGAMYMLLDISDINNPQ